MIFIIHDWDTHFWLAKLKDGSWISAEDHCSADPAFAEATLVRIEPISPASIQAVLESPVYEGYTMFLRTDPIIDVTKGQTVGICYVMALERGKFEHPGHIALSQLPLKDGFRAELQIDGNVDFKSSPNFSYEVSQENNIDVYRFFMR